MARNLFSRFLPPIEGSYNADGLNEALCYHRQNDYGYFSILAANASGALKQESYQLSLLPQVIPLLNTTADTYLGQHEFRSPNRRVMNLLRIGLCWVDLDLNKSQLLSGRPESDLDMLMDYHHWNGVMPSAIVYSGVGYHLKWFLDKPVPAQALPRWNAIQTALNLKYKEFGADPQAKDASRVLRLIGTANSKSGRICEVIFPKKESLPVTHDFENLALECLPYERSALDSWKTARTEKEKARPMRAQWENLGAQNLQKSNLNWDRLGDLRALMKIRKDGNGGTVPKGQRDSHLFWQTNFLMLSGATSPKLMYAEAAVLAKDIDPGWGYRSQELGTVYGKAVKSLAGEKIEFNGRLYSPLYTPKSQTLIDIFEITDAEMAWMKTIITPAEAKRRELARDEARRRERGQAPREIYLGAVRVEPEAKAQGIRERVEAWRRTDGQVPREEYLEAARVDPDEKAEAHKDSEEARRRERGQADRETYLESVSVDSEVLSRVKTLKDKGVSFMDIANEIGVSVPTVYRYLKKLNNIS